jgi:hypothetical protein
MKVKFKLPCLFNRLSQRIYPTRLTATFPD